jgi:hypothetical protein
MCNPGMIARVLAGRTPGRRFTTRIEETVMTETPAKPGKKAEAGDKLTGGVID